MYENAVSDVAICFGVHGSYSESGDCDILFKIKLADFTTTTIRWYFCGFELCVNEDSFVSKFYSIKGPIAAAQVTSMYILLITYTELSLNTFRALGSQQLDAS